MFWPSAMNSWPVLWNPFDLSNVRNMPDILSTSFFLNISFAIAIRGILRPEHIGQVWKIAFSLVVPQIWKRSHSKNMFRKLQTDSQYHCTSSFQGQVSHSSQAPITCDEAEHRWPVGWTMNSDVCLSVWRNYLDLTSMLKNYSLW